MANPELALLSAIIRSGSFTQIRQRGVTPDLFLTGEAREIFQWMHEHFNHPQHLGEVPDFGKVCRRFGNFKPVTSRDSVDSLITELEDRRLTAGMKDALDETEKLLLDGLDPSLVLQALLPRLKDLNVSGGKSNHLLMASAAPLLKGDYTTMMETGGITGLPFPWAPLNRGTGGMHPEDFIVIYARPKSMKCVVAGQKIMVPSGHLVPIEELADHNEVASYTKSTEKLRWAQARKVPSGDKECVRVTTMSGHVVETSTEHLFMVPEGSFEDVYERICNLEVGDWIATTRAVPEWEWVIDHPEEAWVIGALIGDGNYTRNELQFTNVDTEIVDEVDRICRELYRCKVVAAYRAHEYRIISEVPGTNHALRALRSMGIHGKKAVDKEVPEWIFTSSPASVAAFLAGLLDTDGTVWTKKPYKVAWYTASEKLARGIHHLLKRLGTAAQLSFASNSHSGQWSVSAYGLGPHQALAREMLPYVKCPRKREGLEKLAEPRATKRNVDGVPYSEELMSLILREKGTKEWPKMGQSYLDRSKLFRRTGKISRRLLKKIANAWDSEPLRKIAAQDLMWEQIKDITPIGKRECWDLIIEDGQDPNFVVEGFVVHNTWLALAICADAYLNGRRVLIYSKEMSDKQMARRVASILAGLDYHEIKTGTLSDINREHYFDMLDSFEHWDKEINPDTKRQAAMSFLSDKNLKGRKGATVDVIMAEAEKFEPDLILVDGFYLMRDGRTRVTSRDWKQISNISADLKNMGQQLSVPVIGTTQANRGAAKGRGDDLGELAFADAIGQDADLVIRIFKGRDPVTGKPALLLVFPGVRDALLNPMIVNAWPGADFSLRMENANVEAFLKDNKVDDSKEENTNSGGGGGKSHRKKGKRERSPTRLPPGLWE